MKEDEESDRRPFRRCLETWPDGMWVENDIAPVPVPDAWLQTKPRLPFPWNGAFLDWQEAVRNEPKFPSVVRKKGQ